MESPPRKEIEQDQLTTNNRSTQHSLNSFFITRSLSVNQAMILLLFIFILILIRYFFSTIILFSIARVLVLYDRIDPIKDQRFGVFDHLLYSRMHVLVLFGIIDQAWIPVDECRFDFLAWHESRVSDFFQHLPCVAVLVRVEIGNRLDIYVDVTWYLPMVQNGRCLCESLLREIRNERSTRHA